MNEFDVVIWTIGRFFVVVIVVVTPLEKDIVLVKVAEKIWLRQVHEPDFAGTCGLVPIGTTR